MDTEAKKIALWANTGDRTDPDDASLNPVLVRTTGWPSTFSADSGETVRRRVINQIFRELTGVAVDVMREGVPLWDTDINYRQHAITNRNGVLYRATVANGPATSNATDPEQVGQTVWVVQGATVRRPSAPAGPQATAPQSGELDWFWPCPLDGGSIVTSFNFQWRLAGQTTWSASVVINTPRHVLTGLTNGQAVQARVQAVNAQGAGPWSAIGTATPAGTMPGGGATLALRAEAGDQQVALNWLEPDDGGVTITEYLVQWRTQSQAFSTGRQVSVNTTMRTITSLTNGTAYFFQVRAVNGQGNGAWSNEASATPMATVAPPMPDPDTVPSQVPSAPTGLALTDGRILWTWPVPDDGGPRITSFDFQWREEGDAWAAMNIIQNIAASAYLLGSLTNGTTYEARVRAVNSEGTAASWSATGSATAALTSDDVLLYQSATHDTSLPTTATALASNIHNYEALRIVGWVYPSAGVYEQQLFSSLVAVSQLPTTETALLPFGNNSIRLWRDGNTLMGRSADGANASVVTMVIGLPMTRFDVIYANTAPRTTIGAAVAIGTDLDQYQAIQIIGEGSISTGTGFIPYVAEGYILVSHIPTTEANAITLGKHRATNGLVIWRNGNTLMAKGGGAIGYVNFVVGLNLASA